MLNGVLLILSEAESWSLAFLLACELKDKLLPPARCSVRTQVKVSQEETDEILLAQWK